MGKIENPTFSTPADKEAFIKTVLHSINVTRLESCEGDQQEHVNILGVEIPLATLDCVTWKTPSEFDVADSASLLFDGDLIESLKSLPLLGSRV